jgi:glutathione synthase/RimK-type ligase-like ATP-grasp enzyme
VTGWLIIVDHMRDLAQADTPHKVLSVRDYLARPQLFGEGRESFRPNVINLSRSYNYQSAGYYASLLAEARGHRVIPVVQTMLELSRKGLYSSALPELEVLLNKAINKSEALLPERLTICFGKADQPGFERFGRLLFDWFRTPIVEVKLTAPDPASGWISIDKVRPLSVHRLTDAQRQQFIDALANHTRRRWSGPKKRANLRYSLAVLHNPKEAMPPTITKSLERLAKVGARMGIEIEPIHASDLDRLAEFDGLWIRETTSIDNHTYRFARRAEQEGMPVMDDTMSMIRCTNKVYLKELLEAHHLPMPKSLVLSERDDLAKAEAVLDYPMVVKIPDGSFSRGVHKVRNRDELNARAAELFVDTDLILLQEFMPTDFDWRVGVLDGEPLFVCKYMMAKKHWQIVKHEANGQAIEGGFECVPVDEAPRDVVDVAVKAASLIGNGLYGVDLKQNERGVFIIEINDNPNMDHGVEGAVLKDAMWEKLLNWYLVRLNPI